MPILSLFGMFAAGYLLYVETNPVQAICGPVGNCNAVQSSPYSRLFGILPVGLVGLLGYLAVLAVWLWKRLRSDRLAEMAPMAIMGMAENQPRSYFYAPGTKNAIMAGGDWRPMLQASPTREPSRTE